jgi:uncharacterized membrane protein
MNTIRLGIAVVIMGFIMIFAGALFSGAQFGGVVMIGPVPLIFGSFTGDDRNLHGPGHHPDDPVFNITETLIMWLLVFLGFILILVGTLLIILGSIRTVERHKRIIPTPWKNQG